MKPRKPKTPRLKLFSAEVCKDVDSYNWFNFKASSPLEVTQKIVEIRDALKNIGVTLTEDDDVDVFKRLGPQAKTRSVFVKTICPYCNEWSWESIDSDFKCIFRCSNCSESYHIFSPAILESMGMKCKTCTQRITCLSVPIEF